jgi:hypothetical protein
MKRLAFRLTWRHTLPDKEHPAVNAAEGRDQPWRYWYRRAEDGKRDLAPDEGDEGYRAADSHVERAKRGTSTSRSRVSRVSCTRSEETIAGAVIFPYV